jgi:hypothetical protein
VSADAFTVEPDAVSRHSGADDAAGDAIAQAAEAAATTCLDAHAYGFLCQFLPMVLEPLQLKIVEALKSECQALHTAASLLLDVAAQYEQTEADIDQLFRDVATGLGVEP